MEFNPVQPNVKQDCGKYYPSEEQTVDYCIYTYRLWEYDWFNANGVTFGNMLNEKKNGVHEHVAAITDGKMIS